MISLKGTNIKTYIRFIEISIDNKLIFILYISMDKKDVHIIQISIDNQRILYIYNQRIFITKQISIDIQTVTTDPPPPFSK